MFMSESIEFADGQIFKLGYCELFGHVARKAGTAATSNAA